MDEAVNVQEETKLLGAQVPEDIYWKFKETASTRKETMQEAIINAALMYMDVQKGDKPK